MNYTDLAKEDKPTKNDEARARIFKPVINNSAKLSPKD